MEREDKELEEDDDMKEAFQMRGKWRKRIRTRRSTREVFEVKGRKRNLQKESWRNRIRSRRTMV